MYLLLIKSCFDVSTLTESGISNLENHLLAAKRNYCTNFKFHVFSDIRRFMHTLCKYQRPFIFLVAKITQPRLFVGVYRDSKFKPSKIPRLSAPSAEPQRGVVICGEIAGKSWPRCNGKWKWKWNREEERTEGEWLAAMRFNLIPNW